MMDIKEIQISDIDGLFGFIYITLDNINGKYYIGQRAFARGWKQYLGSGIYLKRAIKKYGKENFNKIIIDVCSTKEELDKREIYWISHYDAVNNSLFYNISFGGTGGDTYASLDKEQLDDIKKRISNTLKGKNKGKFIGKNNPMSKTVDIIKDNEIIETCDTFKELVWWYINNYPKTSKQQNYKIAKKCLETGEKTEEGLLFKRK